MSAGLAKCWNISVYLFVSSASLIPEESQQIVLESAFQKSPPAYIRKKSGHFEIFMTHKTPNILFSEHGMTVSSDWILFEKEGSESKKNLKNLKPP